MEVQQKLDDTERERDRFKALLGSLRQNQQSDSASTIDELKAERLQLQAELENLRSSVSSELETVRGANEQEIQALKEKLHAAEQEQRGVAKNMEVKLLKAALVSLHTCTCMDGYGCAFSIFNLHAHVHIHVITSV